MSEEKIAWSAGTVIYEYGSEPEYAYLLLNGELEILSDKGIRVGFINKDEVFGEQSIILKTKRTVTAKAIKNSQGLLIPKETLLKNYNNSSYLIKAILRSTYMRLTNLNSTLKENLKSI